MSAAVPVEASELAAVRRLLRDPSPSARAAAIRRLTGDASRAATRLVIERMGDPHPYVRRAAAAVLGQLLDADARRNARRQIRRQRSAPLRAAACHAYRGWLDGEGRMGLDDALRDRDPSVRIAALHALQAWARDAAELPGKATDAHTQEPPPAPAPTRHDVAAAARTLLEDRDGAARAHAVDVIRSLDEDVLDTSRWVALTKDTDARVRLAALEGSVALGGESAMVAVLHGLNDAVWSVRLTAAELAGAVLERRVLEALPAHLDDKRWVVRTAVHRALVRLTGIPFDPVRARWEAWLRGDGKSFDPVSRAGMRERKHRPGTHTRVKALGLPITSDHVAFVLDTSKSMKEMGADGRTRWAAICEELDVALGAMARIEPGPAHVAVHCFATDVRSVAKRAAALTATLRKRIAVFLNKQEPKGRTALFDGIATALDDPQIDTLVVLSDGAPSAGAWFTKSDLLAGIRAANRFRRARIHVVAVGIDGIAKRWRDVLALIASDHGGRYLAR